MKAALAGLILLAQANVIGQPAVDCSQTKFPVRCEQTKAEPPVWNLVDNIGKVVLVGVTIGQCREKIMGGTKGTCVPQ